MDIHELKRQSDLSYDTAVAKRNALEHLFRADPTTICLVRTLKESRDNFYLLDTNSNPVEITDPAEFLSILVERNQEGLNTYHQIYKTFTKKDA